MYKHRPLSSARSIRVINLKGTRRSLFHSLFGWLSSAEQQQQQLQLQQHQQPLEVELEEVSLDSSPSYEALSYTWDGQTPDRPIKCHGRTMKITKNCETALLRLRRKSDRRLWIDSICIDQQSVPEKNTQVPLMGEIYGKCRKVLVWLGEGTEASDRSFEYLKDIFSILILDHRMWRIMQRPAAALDLALVHQLEERIRERKEAFRGMYFSRLIDEGSLMPGVLIQDQNIRIYGREGTPSCNMLYDIFTRSWFTRMWTVQELSLGADALILCGDSEMPWLGITIAMTWLGLIEKSTAPNAANDSQFLNVLHIYQRLRGIIQPCPIPRLLTEQQKDRRISTMVRFAHPLSSWDPRDKIYGLYGCFSAAGYRNLLPVDYDQPVSQVYSEYARSTMLRE